MVLPSLSQFCLVRGTAMALRYSHRSSIDLDFFYHQKFDHSVIESELRSEFGDDFTYEQGHRNLGIFCYIRKVKIDIVHFPHMPIGNIVVQSGLRMYDDSDIASMKIQAILGRARKKDFWDLHELLKHYSLKQMIDWHKQKYPSQMLAISIPNAITYFSEADNSETPVSFSGQTWAGIKKEISKVVSDYLR